MFLGYALGKELDDLERFDDAFRCFCAAARARRERLDYDVAVDVRKLARIAAVYDPDSLRTAARPAASPCAPPLPVAHHQSNTDSPNPRRSSSRTSSNRRG